MGESGLPVLIESGKQSNGSQVVFTNRRNTAPSEVIHVDSLICRTVIFGGVSLTECSHAHPLTNTHIATQK